MNENIILNGLWKRFYSIPLKNCENESGIKNETNE